VKVLSDIQIGYLAGIIDGEGFITLTKSPDRQMQPRVGISNTDLDLMNTIADWVGDANILRESKGSNRQKDAFRIQWQGRAKILEILEFIEPYLIVKKAHAQLVIAWIKFRMNGYSEIDLGNGYINGIRVLNMKGKKEML